MYLGIDLGTSSVKLTLFDAGAGEIVASVVYPKTELPISSPQPGWAEQDPEMWWQQVLEAYNVLRREQSFDTKALKAIGIAYQMHGLVLVDKNLQVLRPSIIWCDSRAVETGNEAFQALGEDFSLTNLLNSPGNFTAAKLGWVKKNEPETYAKIYKFMLPGDFIAMRLSGRVTTTQTGLSEGVFWNFPQQEISSELLSYFGISQDLIPEIVPAIGAQVKISEKIAAQLGLNPNVKITYRAGDQPNNAFSLNVLNPGETAATAGTSGVIYAVTDRDAYDEKSRINTFLHVNNTPQLKRNGILICINGTAILYSWLKKLFNVGNGNLDYPQLNELASVSEAGAEGVHFYPFGNGAERVFENRIIGSHILNMDFNRHSAKHIVRSGLEGVIYALNLGFEMLKNLDVPQNTIRAGHTNLFLSETFRHIFVNVTGVKLELYQTDGAAGAARGAALGAGFFSDAAEAFSTLKRLEVIEPDSNQAAVYNELFRNWKKQGEFLLEQQNEPQLHALD